LNIFRTRGFSTVSLDRMLFFWVWVQREMKVVVLARNQVFPAIVLFAMSFFLVSFFSLLVFSASITWSACWHFLHIGSRDRQVDFVGSVFWR